MRTIRRLVVAAAFVLPLAVVSGGYAVDELKPHPGGLIEAQWLIGRPVINANGKDIGKVENLWVDPKDGRVKQLVVSVGGVLGIADKHKLVPWQDVKVAWEKERLLVRIEESKLRSAAPYTAGSSRR
jgi:sporulation protein YlmC with PRC-barrel domain